MSKKAAEFVAKLSEDPKKRDAYMADPDAAMEAHGGLSDQDKKVLRTKDADAVKKYLGDDSPPGCLVFA